MTAFASLKLIFVSSRILGLFPFTFRISNGVFAFAESKNLLTYSKIVAILFALSEIYLMYIEAVLNLDFAPQSSSKTIFVLSVLSVAWSAFMVFQPILTKRKTFCLWLNKMGYIFSNLKRRKLQKVTAFYFLVLFAILFYLTASAIIEFHMYDFTHVLSGGSYGWLQQPYILLIFYYFSTIEIKMFVQLFLMFANLIGFYYVETHETLKSGERNADKEFWLGYLRELRSKDLEVKDLLDFLHSFFGPVVSLQLLWGFFAALFNVTVTTKIGIPPLVQLLWGTYIFCDAFMVVALCHVVEKEGDKTAHYLHRLFISWDDKELKKEIDIFSLQLQHRKLEFNAMGGQKLNFSLIYSMTGVFTSYAIVLVQIQNEPDKGKYCLCKNSSSVYFD